MTAALYRVAAAMAGEYRAGYLPAPYRLAGPVPHMLPLRPRAIYIAVDAGGVIRYVGSVCRPRRTAVCERAAEHVRKWFKQRNWTTVYVVPLAPTTPSAVVKQIEGRIGHRLKPVDNRPTGAYIAVG
jgi:hypothetical protein